MASYYAAGLHTYKSMHSSEPCSHHVLLLLQVEVEVLVPWSWPSGPAALQLVDVSSPELSADAAAALLSSINSHDELLSSCDLLQLLQRVESMVEAQVVEAAVA